MLAPKSWFGDVSMQKLCKTVLERNSEDFFDVRTDKNKFSLPTYHS